MDPRERMNDPLVAMRAMLRGWQSNIWTSLPGIIQSFDATKMTAVVQPAIQAQVRTTEGAWNNVTLPVCLDVPVFFPWGGGFGVTLPLAGGDTGGLLFSSRCIDSWWQNGGVQPQAEFRLHNLSDGMFIPGLFSQNSLPANVSTSSLQVRSLDGQTYLEVGPGKIQLVADEVVIHGRNKTTFDAGGTGFVYTPAKIDTYTTGVPTVAHVPTPPEVPT